METSVVADAYGFVPMLNSILSAGPETCSFRREAVIPSLFNAERSALVAFFVPSLDPGSTYTTTPEIPAVKNVAEGGGVYFHLANVSALTILFAIDNDSVSSQYGTIP